MAERTRYNVDMEKVTVLANAKLNLYLDVAGTRADGYHDLDMLMVTVNCGDVITVRKAESGFLSVKMDGAEAGEENTAYRTARLVCDLTGSGLDITIAKKIPIGAGMGGSSADSAGVLNAAKKLLGISDSAANEIALQVGSDVVYMMRGGIMRARGRGEILTPVEGLESLRSKFFVVAQKCMGATTAKVFSHFDTLGMQPKNSFDKTVSSLKTGRYEDGLYNALFLSATYHCPSIVATMFDLKNFSSAACMTGSGSACFAIFDDFAKAKECYESLQHYKYKNIVHIV